MKTTLRDQAPAPPKGFRKAIPAAVKVDVVIRQAGNCKTCGERLGTLSNTQFDHVPAIQLRVWNVEAKDTAPPSNSPEHIEAKHIDCHAAKTTGRKGESRLNALHGDIQLIAKQRRLEAKEADFRRRILAQDTKIEQPPDRRKHRWPKRPMRSGAFEKQKRPIATKATRPPFEG